MEDFLWAVGESYIHQKHHYTCQNTRNMSNSCPLLVIGPVSSWSRFHAGGLLSGILSSFFKKSPINVLQHRRRTTWPFLHFCTICSNRHHICCSASPAPRRPCLSGKEVSVNIHSKTVRGSEFYIHADSIARRHKQWEHLPVLLQFVRRPGRKSWHTWRINR